MDNKLLLVKAITLMYLNGKIEDKSKDAVSLAKDVLDTIKPKDKGMEAEFGKDAVSELRDTLVEMLSQPLGTNFSETELTQRFKIGLKDNDHLFEALTSAFVSDEEPKENIQKMFNSQKNAIRSFINKNKIAEIMKQYYIKTSFHSEQVDHKSLLTELTESLAPYVNSEAGGDNIFEHPSIVNNTSFGDKDTLSKVFNAAKDELDSRGVIKTPYQGLNRMMGAHNGMRRGETIVVTALTHNYKSGLVMDLFLGCALFNTPYMRDPSKKPLNLRISFENTTMQDLNHMYPKVKETETQLKVDMRKIEAEEASDYLMTKLSEKGYHNRIIHIEPSDFTYHDIYQIIEQFEEDGYEIHLLTIDYLNMMSKAGCTQGATGDDVRDLFRRIRNFCLRRGITLVSPHQFSSEARKIERGEPKNFVKHVTGKGFYDGCSRLEQELDLEISLHIVVVNGESYLTMQRGKHRGIVTPTSHLYTVYKFEEFGGIPMDVDREDCSRKSVGGDTMADGGAPAWYNDI